METMTKTKISTSTKQKVIAAVAMVAVLAGLVGLVSALGKAKGMSFGSLFFKRTAIEKKTEPKKNSTADAKENWHVAGLQ